jgi:hypothetical protein
MLNHPHDCPVCDEGGECHLQDMTLMTGHVYRRKRFDKRTYRNQYLGPFIKHEMNRCIECYRCVRYYRDFAGGRDLDVFASPTTTFTLAARRRGPSKASSAATWWKSARPAFSPTKPTTIPLRPQMGPADRPVGVRALQPGLQHHSRRALWSPCGASATAITQM